MPVQSQAHAVPPPLVFGGHPVYAGELALVTMLTFLALSLLSLHVLPGLQQPFLPREGFGTILLVPHLFTWGV